MADTHGTLWSVHYEYCGEDLPLHYLPTLLFYIPLQPGGGGWGVGERDDGGGIHCCFLWSMQINICDYEFHNALDRYPTMHHFATEMCTHKHNSFTEWCIVAYGTGTLWGLCNRSIDNHAIVPVLEEKLWRMWVKSISSERHNQNQIWWIMRIHCTFFHISVLHLICVKSSLSSTPVILYHWSSCVYLSFYKMP